MSVLLMYSCEKMMAADTSLSAKKKKSPPKNITEVKIQVLFVEFLSKGGQSGCYYDSTLCGATFFLAVVVNRTFEKQHSHLSHHMPCGISIRVLTNAYTQTLHAPWALIFFVSFLLRALYSVSAHICFFQ